MDLWYSEVAIYDDYSEDDESYLLEQYSFVLFQADKTCHLQSSLAHGLNMTVNLDYETEWSCTSVKKKTNRR